MPEGTPGDDAADKPGKTIDVGGANTEGELQENRDDGEKES